MNLKPNKFTSIFIFRLKKSVFTRFGFNSYIVTFFLLFSICYKAIGQIITTVAGSGTAGYSGDGGLATGAQFNNPISVAFDASGNLFISDFYNHRIRKVAVGTGIVTTIAGTGTGGFSGDGTLATNAQINNPGDLCLDISGNIYFVDNRTITNF